MTNLEYYGFKNLEFKEHIFPNSANLATSVTGLYGIIISYDAAHSKRPIELARIIVSKDSENKEKVMWLLDEHKPVKLSREEVCKYGHVNKGGYSC